MSNENKDCTTCRHTELPVTAEPRDTCTDISIDTGYHFTKWEPTNYERIAALEALALELADKLLESLLHAAIEVGDLPPDYGQTRGARRALSSPLLAALRAKADPHASDCATHNMPAMSNGPCDCGAHDRAKEAGEVTDTSRLSRISIERHGAGYQAHINGDRRMWGYGASMYEAIGNAVNAHAADIGVTIEGRAKEA